MNKAELEELKVNELALLKINLIPLVDKVYESIMKKVADRDYSIEIIQEKISWYSTKDIECYKVIEFFALSESGAGAMYTVNSKMVEKLFMEMITPKFSKHDVVKIELNRSLRKCLSVWFKIKE